jgi:hypothetical protein
VVLVHQGTVEEGDRFFAKFWPDAIAIADPERVLYTAFGLGPGTVGQVIGPRALLAAGRALLRGNLVGKPVGDVKVMPGAFLVEDKAIAWSHDYAHSGDRPDFASLLS